MKIHNNFNNKHNIVRSFNFFKRATFGLNLLANLPLIYMDFLTFNKKRDYNNRRVNSNLL
jgi:hypothetical protein